jgi:tRNA pseudouridine65 synthase
VGDATHGKGLLNRAVADWLGISRLWLHALECELPHPGGSLRITAPAGPEWKSLLTQPGG